MKFTKGGKVKFSFLSSPKRRKWLNLAVFSQANITQNDSKNSLKTKFNCLNLTGKLTSALLASVLIAGCGSKFDYIASPVDGLAIASKERKFGFIDEQQNIIIPLVYEQVWGFADGLAAARKDGKIGFIDRQNHVAIPFIYDSAESFKDGLAAVSYEQKFGFIDRQNRLVIGLDYESIGEFSEGRVRVQKNGKWGVIDREGRLTIPFIYDEITDFSGGLATVRVNDKWGVINKFGDIVVQPAYDKPTQIKEQNATSAFAPELNLSSSNTKQEDANSAQRSKI